VEEVEMADEPDYAFFNGFSSSAGGPAPNRSTNVTEELPAPTVTIEPRASPVIANAYDIPPLDLFQARWTFINS